jgi:hypothetical protein
MKIKLDEMSKADLIELGKSLGLKVNARMKESSLIDAIVVSEYEDISYSLDGENLSNMDKDELVTLGKSLGVKVDKRMLNEKIIKLICSEYPTDVNIHYNSDDVTMVSPNTPLKPVEDDEVDLEDAEPEFDAEAEAAFEAEAASEAAFEFELEFEAEESEQDTLRSLTEEDLKNIDTAKEFDVNVEVERDDPEDEDVNVEFEGESVTVPEGDQPDDTYVASLAKRLSDVTILNESRQSIKLIDIKKYMFGTSGKDQRRITRLDKEICDLLYKYGIKDLVDECINANVAPLHLQFAATLEKLWEDQGYLMVRSNWNSWWIIFDKRGNRE